MFLSSGSLHDDIYMPPFFFYSIVNCECYLYNQCGIFFLPEVQP